LVELPRRQRECAGLFYFAEIGVAQIADMLCMKENAVKAALFKARKNLTVHLRRKGVVP
jgi:DNA-directed RNA polymerase specialized sigma24 family protein